MFNRERKFYTPEEYLALEESDDYKSEYYNGEIFAMAGGSANHNRIGLNVATMFNLAFENRSCEVFMSDMRLLVEQVDLYTYPDVMLVCGKIEFVPKRVDTLTNPILIVEVLSESTENYDRGKKFEFYRTIPALQHYLLISQDRVYLEHFQKLEDGRWALTEYNEVEKVLRIEALDFKIALSRIYNKVEWKES